MFVKFSSKASLSNKHSSLQSFCSLLHILDYSLSLNFIAMYFIDYSQNCPFVIHFLSVLDIVDVTLVCDDLGKK